MFRKSWVGAQVSSLDEAVVCLKPGVLAAPLGVELGERGVVRSRPPSAAVKLEIGRPACRLPRRLARVAPAWTQKQVFEPSADCITILAFPFIFLSRLLSSFRFSGQLSSSRGYLSVLRDLIRSALELTRSLESETWTISGGIFPIYPT